MDRIKLSRRVLGVSILCRFLWRFTIFMSIAMLSLCVFGRPTPLPLFLSGAGLMAVNALLLWGCERMLRWVYRQTA